MKLTTKGALALTMLSITSFSEVQAQSLYSPKRQSKKLISFAMPQPPATLGEPGVRFEASSRGGCENLTKQMSGSKEKKLTALAPTYGPTHSGLVLGMTTETHPTFWFYVPYLGALPGKFVLQEADKTIYQTPVSLPGTPGVVRVSLPSKVAPLKNGQSYHWFFNVYCQEGQPPAFVHGWIKRDSLSLMLRTQLERSTPKQRVALYAANGIWYDALTTSDKLRHTDPKDSNWVDLLRAVGLGDVAPEPLIVVASKPITR